MQQLSDERTQLAKRIYEVSYLEGEFTLRSGQTSNVYFDKYRFESDPTILKEIVHQMLPLIPEGTEVLAGLELGGIPVATMLSAESGIPATFVRKKAKEYGTCRISEGADVEGKVVVIVEDVVTTGGQIIESARELRALGALVSTVLCVIERDTISHENLAKHGLTLVPLLKIDDLYSAARQI